MPERFPEQVSPAAVREEPLTERVVLVTKELLGRMGVEAEVLCRDRRADDSPHLWVEILTKESRLLIGERGSTLVALEHVLRRCLRSVCGDDLRVVADVNAYRVHRIEIIQRLARQAVERVQRTGRAVVLEPMRPAERRTVHVALTDVPSVTTESIGEEPLRRVIFRPKDPLA
jgi:spoIIIJ-associated protein